MFNVGDLVTPIKTMVEGYTIKSGEVYLVNKVGESLGSQIITIGDMSWWWYAKDFVKITMEEEVQDPWWEKS